MTDLRKLLVKLFAHGAVQFLYDALQGFLCLHQVIMLGFHKCVTLHQIFIIFNGIYIHISQFPDLVF